ncbi:MAG: hypothetical protein IH586_05965 [Anaerolineaceae bacterium]|nr:hypothetical protein [Anaerolineaceae bacterium]
MLNVLSMLLDRLSEFFAHRKGLLPLIGVTFVLLNFALQFFPTGWLIQTNCFLHLGILLAILGFLFARAL